MKTGRNHGGVIKNKLNITLLGMKIHFDRKTLHSSTKRHIADKTNFTCGWQKKTFSLFETIHFVFTFQLNHDMRTVHSKIYCTIVLCVSRLSSNVNTKRTVSNSENVFAAVTM